MKTSSCWGTPPTRLYRFIDFLSTQKNDATVCIVGCSDGKFVFPFLRKGFNVTAIDFDKVALYGGKKLKPINRDNITKIEYHHVDTSPEYIKLPTEEILINGLKNRAEIEKLNKNLRILETDFYAYPPQESFDVLFTSCSLQYKSNRAIPIENIMDTLKSHVNVNGYLYMDYMMPLEDTHTWKSDHFFRTGQIKNWFSEGWKIIYIREMKKPIFEVAHVDRPEDHFHRFGYILAQKEK